MNGNLSKEDLRILLLYLLKQINSICETHNIPYYASGGTCLGAIRHGGLIPWDDDIDIMMERKYYDLFVNACSEMLPSLLVLRTRESDPYFCHEYAKLCFIDDKIKYSDVSIDVFFLDETDPNRTIFRAIQNKILNNLYYIKLFKVSKKKQGKQYKPQNFFKRCYLNFFSFLPYSFIDSIHKKTMMAQKKTTDYWINWGSCYSYKKATYKKEALGVPKKVNFENTYIYIAENPNEILVHLYGEDYMTPPPLEKRKAHGIGEINCNKLDINTIREEVGGVTV